MSLVFAGVCSHAPGIVGRRDRADPVLRDGFYAAYERMRLAMEATRPDALVVLREEGVPIAVSRTDDTRSTRRT